MQQENGELGCERSKSAVTASSSSKGQHPLPVLGSRCDARSSRHKASSSFPSCAGAREQQTESKVAWPTPQRTQHARCFRRSSRDSVRRRVWFASHRTFLTWSASKSSCIVKRTSTPDCSSCDRSAEDRYDRTAWVFRVEKANTPMYDRLVSVTLVASTTPLWNHLPVPRNKLWLASRFHSDGSVPLALDLCSTTLEPRFASPTGTIVQSCTQGPCWFVKGSFSRTSRPHVLRSSAYRRAERFRVKPRCHSALFAGQQILAAGHQQCTRIERR